MINVLAKLLPKIALIAQFHLQLMDAGLIATSVNDLKMVYLLTRHQYVPRRSIMYFCINITWFQSVGIGKKAALIINVAQVKNRPETVVDVAGVQVQAGFTARSITQIMFVKGDGEVIYGNAVCRYTIVTIILIG
jgi:hypothetical protein